MILAKAASAFGTKQDEFYYDVLNLSGWKHDSAEGPFDGGADSPLRG